MKISIRKIGSTCETLIQFWPNAKCELIHYNSFQLLLAVMLSAQTTDIQVNKALSEFYKKNQNFSPKDLINLGETHFYSLIRSINYAPTKAKRAMQIAESLETLHGGQVPNQREELEKLSGVGPKTASVVLNVAFGQKCLAVDTHVERVSKRLGWVDSKMPTLKIENHLLGILPQKRITQMHHVLIFHGRYLCTARAPKCDECPVKSDCLFESKNISKKSNRESP